jgi:hypothetical protein
VTPEEIEALMPCVHHFHGPCIMVEAILKSRLAKQLETLTLSEFNPHQLGYCKDLLPRLGRLRLPELSHLKCFGINSRSVPWQAIAAALVDFVKATPMLEVLELCGSWEVECTLHDMVSISYLERLNNMINPAWYRTLALKY